MEQYADPARFDQSRRRLRLIELAEQHVELFGDEEFDLVDWDVDVDDPVELAEIAEEIADLKRLTKLIEDEVKARLRAALHGNAIRMGDAVYVEGMSSGSWKPTRRLWLYVADRHDLDPEGLASALDEIVSGVRVTAVDALAEDVDRQTVRDTFLDYRPGRPGLQRKDLTVQAVAKTARRWWPTQDGEITHRPRREETT